MYFRHTKFYGYETTFREARFEYSTDFRKAEFIGGGADFSEAKFIDEEIYGGGNFFSKAKFIGGDANFRKAKFRKNAVFKKVEFEWSAIFTETIFKGGAIFKKARFKWSALFQNTQFSGCVCFQNARFKRKADFTSPGNKKDIDALQGKVDFSGAEFLDEVSFNNRKFRQETSFKNCNFHKAPRFHGCKLHQDTNFTDARFLDTQGDEAARAYRALKLDMEEKRARQEQLVFYALEMKSRRSAEKRKFLKFFSWLYEATSDYGQRIFLPLVWLGFLFALFAFFYAVYFKELLHLDTASILSQSLHFSIKQIIRPFGLFGSSSLSDFFVQTPSKNLLALPLIIAAALQSFLSLALLLLSTLAARWRFKIG